jgi:small GTP-binding protein
MASVPSARKHKVLVVGMTNTGKTSIIRQYVDGVFGRGNFPTVLPLADSVPFHDDSGSYEIAIWDTAGADEWLSMNMTAFRAPDAIVFVASYDLALSLPEAITKWVPILSDHVVLDDVLKILAMNKIDIADAGEGEVTEQNIEQTRQELKAQLFQVSAKENKNVREMFEFVAAELRKRDPDVHPQVVPPEPKSWCC